MAQRPICGLLPSPSPHQPTCLRTRMSEGAASVWAGHRVLTAHSQEQQPQCSGAHSQIRRPEWQAEQSWPRGGHGALCCFLSRNHRPLALGVLFCLVFSTSYQRDDSMRVASGMEIFKWWVRKKLEDNDCSCDWRLNTEKKAFSSLACL